MITDQLTALLQEAVASAKAAGDLNLDNEPFEVSLEPPKHKDFGDFASNLAMTLQKKAGLPPREVAARIVKHIPADNTLIDKVEIAGPGFMNFYLKPDWLHDALVQIETEDNSYGTNTTRVGEKTLIEFVSANPTGPISVVNGRAAALGDTLANLLAACGAEVQREFYINDALNSTQLNLLGQSLAIRYMQLLGHDEYQLGPDHYQGEYVTDIARDVLAKHGNEFESLEDVVHSPIFREFATPGMLEQQKRDLAAFGVVFDTWFRESSLYDSGAVKAGIEEMKARGMAYEKDGALWLKTTELSKDDQDRVLVRSNDRETYIAADAAYHKNKFDRGFNRLINIWGADHHGYVERLKAGVAALGYDPAKCEIILTQMIMLLRDGEPVRGGKRTGDIIPLVDLVNEVGKDAARFYCMLNSYETTATFDLELAKRQSSDNPVFYAQYAHARCCTLLAQAVTRGVAVPKAAEVDRSQLKHEKELFLLRKLADYPAEVALAADMIAPHRLTAYVREIGQALHQFYEECPTLKEGIAPEVRDARLTLFNATRIVVRNLLGLMGVSAPEKM